MSKSINAEQLAKWRVDFESRYNPDQLNRWMTDSQNYKHIDVDASWGTYVEAREDAKQETEQAVKDARKQALEEVIALGAHIEYRASIQNLAIAEYVTQIKGLLK